MVAIVNYGVGNLTSILNMFRRIGVDACITGDKETIQNAGKILLPGIGHFDSCMERFNASGLRQVVESRAFDGSTPVLGICVGAQMMTRKSEEGSEKGLGWIAGDTVRFRHAQDSSFKVPHMGWSDIRVCEGSVLMDDLPEEPRFYFAHSFHFQLDEPAIATTRCEYGYDFVSSFRLNNIHGVQFHPEKSHRYGMRLLSNFGAL
ncbi:imidazole glycerol phosphate synthase subunit HisH [Flavihumibacter petaseus]|uniref:Imidazole glycerol phosphate synthase subunit HisH n=1 Tax=Flavihumibacter petaseus NBRC 106054 TaxID=1220578 RepID=A0A0E9N5Y6_9BACT|nr:imidazole glycerol phosphate synthase subunit HisH [Flavihumibacter petaseus]GAO45218.1 imidazole glycerol phosphate synthase subunit HisH [Flavihumibacter petaseus NBRC 106054]